MEKNNENNMQKNAKTYEAISLFTGAGGMDVGFDAAGFNIVCANEINTSAGDTYESNFTDVQLIRGDVNDCIDAFPQETNVVFGGPPCQGFSIAGKMSKDDPRSKLIFSFLDIVKRCSPDAFVMENVKALISLEKFSDIRQKYLEKSKTLGYTVVPILCLATDFGVPQKRERVFFIGLKRNRAKELIEKRFGFCTQEYFEKTYACIVQRMFDERKIPAQTVKESLRDLGIAGTDKNPLSCTSKITYVKKPIIRKSPYAGMLFNGSGRPIDLDGYANTLPASMGGNHTPIIDEQCLHDLADENWVVSYHAELVAGKTRVDQEVPARMRRITIKEAAKLQTFPDDYVWEGSKSAIYKQIGNAVPCKLAEAVANVLMEMLHESEAKS